MMNTRRDFLKGIATAAAGSAVSGCLTGGRAGQTHDPELTVFLSDIHVHGRKQDPVAGSFAYTQRELNLRIEEILAMRPLPRQVVTFGDLCFNCGEIESYRVAKEQFARLEAVGIKVVHGMGNHDRRNTFLEVFPDCAKLSPVKGRIVSIVDLGTSDLVLLDSLRGKDGEKAGPVDGALDEPQQEWLKGILPKWPRPVFVAAHHSDIELKVCGQPMGAFLKSCPNVMGYIHGHDHTWCRQSIVTWSTANEDTIRALILPSAGLWGDIGSVTFRTSADCAVATLHQTDYWFNVALREGERKPRLWRQIVAENQGQTCTFPYERLLRPRWSTLLKKAKQG